MKINEVVKIGTDIDKNMEFGKNVHGLFNEIILISVGLAQTKKFENFSKDTIDWSVEFGELDLLTQSFDHFLEQKFEWLKTQRPNDIRQLIKLKTKMKLEVVQSRNNINIIKPLPGIYVHNKK
jgi:hypothetical protein